MKLLIASLIIFLVLTSLTFAQSFKDKVIFSPDTAFLWNFQRGGEELYRFVKFTSTLRVGYSLDLSERRIGEIEVLISKNKTNIIPKIGNEYELELDKIQEEMGSQDILSLIVKSADIKKNVTERLDYNNKVLNIILKDSDELAKTSILNAVKKTSNCLNYISTI